MIKKYSLKHIYYIALCIVSFTNAMAYTQTQSTEQVPQDFGEWKPIVVKDGAIPWTTFAKTKTSQKCETDKSGLDFCFLKPEYSDNIQNYAGKKVKLMGYMWPLGKTEQQDIFLIGAYPLSCPFHYHVGPSQIVEVVTQRKKPIEFTYDPVMVQGTLKISFNKETGVFYYLENAVLMP